MSGSIIMVTYHTGPALRHAVRLALAQEDLAELILVNNGNPPDALHGLAHPKLKVVEGQGNVGFARGCNLGAQHATGDYVLLLNPDCLLPEPTALKTLIHALASHQATLAGPFLQNADGTEQRGGRRALLTPRTALSGLHHHHTPMPAHTHAVPAISGACMCLPRAQFQSLGGLDEGYFLHVEDLDLCMRVAKAGGKTLCVPEVRAVHVCSTSRAPSWVVEKHKARGFARYFRMHFPHHPLRWPLWVAGWARAMVRVFLKPEPPHAANTRLLLFLSAQAMPPIAGIQGMRVLVSGATSPVGMLLLGHLLASGAEVVALSRQAQPAVWPKGARWVQADLHRLPALPEVDAVLHVAPLWTLAPLLAATPTPRVVALGSTSVFAKEHSADPHDRRMAHTLAEAEAALFASRRAWTLLRPTMIYGTGLDGNVSRMARVIRRFGVFPVQPPASGLRQPIHAGDVALAMLQALGSEASVGKAYNISGAEALRYHEMVRRIFRTLGKTPRVLPVPFLSRIMQLGRHWKLGAGMAARMNHDQVFSHEEATRDFGFHPRAFLSGGVEDV